MASYKAIPAPDSISLHYISKNLKEMSSLIKKLKSSKPSSQSALISEISSVSSNLSDIFQSQKPKQADKSSFEALKKQYFDLHSIYVELESSLQRRSKIVSERMSVISVDGLAQHDELVYNTEYEIEENIINEKYNEAEKVHEKILALNEIVKDVALLVNEQGEMLKDVEKNVDNAEKNTDKANQELIKAQDYQSRARRKCCIVLCVILIITMVLLGFTYKDILRFFGIKI